MKNYLLLCGGVGGAKLALGFKNILSEENLAKKNKLGLWAGTFEMPWDWRKK